MSEKEKEQIVSEVNILRELKHPNIVRYYDRIIDKKHSRIYIIMEYCEGGDLNQLIKRCKKTGEFIAEDIIWKIFTQVLLAIHVIHNHKEGKILHRDIKPSNIFLDKDNNVKLGDFGLSRELSDQSKFAYSHVGTPYYMSPEQIDETKYNEKSDIWSLGCFLYELTTFHPPFEAKNQIMLAMRIKSGKVEKINKRYSEELWRVITWMLTVNYNNRPSSEELLNIPEVCIRLREKRIKDTLYKLKMFEEKLNIRDKEQKAKEEQLNEKEKNLKKKENELKEKEEELKEKEIELKEKENELKEKEKKIKNSSTLSNTTTMGYSSKFPSSINSNDLNNMNNSNSNSNNNYMSNNIDVYSIKNNIIKNMINNNNDLNSLLMYSTKNNSSNSGNKNSNNLLITANTNTSINNISLLNNNNSNNSSINNNNNRNSLSNNNYLLTNNLDDDKMSSQKSIKGLADEYSSQNYDTNSKNNYIHYSTNNIYSDYLNNKFKTSNRNNDDILNDSRIKSEFTKIKNNLNSSNISNTSTTRRNNNNVSGSFINSLKKKIGNNSLINDDNNYLNLLNNEKQKYDNNTNEEKKNLYKTNNPNNYVAKKLNEYENSNNNNNEANLRNINLNKTIKYESKSNKILVERESGEQLRKNNSNINSNKRLNERENNLALFNDNENDNYTNLISQINNINTKYGIPTKISLSSKNSKIFEKSNNNNNNDKYNNDSININSNNVLNNINNFNPNLLRKSSKSISSGRNSLNNNLSNNLSNNISNISNNNNNEKNTTNLKTVKNSSRGIGGVNNFYKYNTNNNSAYDFEIANKIGYETGRPSTHCGIIDSFTTNDNSSTTISNVNRINNLSKDNRINSLRNNVKRAKTPKINKIPARCFDNVTPLKYTNNEEEQDNINRVQKIEYGINNYLPNINDSSRTMNNNQNNSNNNIKKLYQKQVDNKSFDRNKTINNTCRNKSGTFTNYKKKK
jgi:NIMA (never in mitosis gene a)-related kinase